MTVPPERRGLRQPDQRSCGAATVVVARARLDPGYADRVCTDQRSFAVEVLRQHRDLTRWPPWPRAIGTPPWAVARALTEITGVRHRTHLLRWRRSAGAGLAGGEVLYVGNRWLPRHVALAVGDDGCYEPQSGRVVRVPADDLRAGRVSVGRWRVPWFVVRPRAPRSPA